MRLYRGLKRPYDPTRVKPGRFDGGTDFTDCPATALRYAQGTRGVVLILDVPDGALGPAGGVTEELWMGMAATRFMVWGTFDEWLTATVPAKDLRTALRERGLRNASDEHKSIVLPRIIGDELRRRERAGRGLAHTLGG